MVPRDPVGAERHSNRHGGVCGFGLLSWARRGVAGSPVRYPERGSLNDLGGGAEGESWVFGSLWRPLIRLWLSDARGGGRWLDTSEAGPSRPQGSYFDLVSGVLLPGSRGKGSRTVRPGLGLRSSTSPQTPAPTLVNLRVLSAPMSGVSSKLIAAALGSLPPLGSPRPLGSPSPMGIAADHGTAAACGIAVAHGVPATRTVAAAHGIGRSGVDLTSLRGRSWLGQSGANLAWVWGRVVIDLGVGLGWVRAPLGAQLLAILRQSGSGVEPAGAPRGRDRAGDVVGRPHAHETRRAILGAGDRAPLGAERAHARQSRNLARALQAHQQCGCRAASGSKGRAFPNDRPADTGSIPKRPRSEHERSPNHSPTRPRHEAESTLDRPPSRPHVDPHHPMST